MKILQEQASNYINIPQAITTALNLLTQDVLVVNIYRNEYINVRNREHAHYAIKPQITVIKRLNYDLSKPNKLRKTTKIVLKKDIMRAMDWSTGSDVYLVINEKNAAGYLIDILPERKINDIDDFFCISDKSLVKQINTEKK